LETSAVFAKQVALDCKAKPALQLKHVAMVAVKQDAQFVPQAVAEVKMVDTHAVVPVYPAVQLAHARTVPVSEHEAQFAVIPVRVVVVAPATIPVMQLTQVVPERTYPALQSVQVAAAALHKRQFVSLHARRAQTFGEAPVKTYPGLHVVHSVPAPEAVTGM